MVFGKPERHADQSYIVPLLTPQKLNIRVHVSAEGIRPTLEYQSIFQTLQSTMLQELVKNRQLYRSPPTLESLQCMTSVWGFVKVGTEIKSSSATIVQNNIPASQWPCIADFVLTGLKLSRTAIQPIISLVYLESAIVPKDEIIDFDWGVPQEESELEEVSDVSILPTASGDILKIKDPATLAREKAEAKERVRDAYRNAEAVREEAETLAARFYASYDVSDTESAFSEWASDSDSDTDADASD
jgi:hypothetical protein